jgi:hypothetical protein
LGGSRTWENGSWGSGRFRGNGYVVEYSGNVTETVLTAVQTLTADTSQITDPEGLGAFNYQWQALNDGIWYDIQGASASAFETDDSGAVESFRVLVSYVDGEGTLETVISDSFVLA